MPRGNAFCGSFASSAVVATTSKPMNAKNTRLAAASNPYHPNVLPVRRVVVGVDVEQTDDDHQQHHRDLDRRDHQ
ncbi:Uncharacterised protein [Mycobacteroides abscessus subsp. abscessus]|nr:Uncharacterised protein [Mycobacteroides abscessus subsp. abscessus]